MSRTSLIKSYLRHKFWEERISDRPNPIGGEVILDPNWSLRWDDSSTPLRNRTLRVFQDFCLRKFDLHFGASDQKSIQWQIAGQHASSDEAFTIHTDSGSVIIEAGSERGLLRGTFYLIRLMSDRKAPYIPKGSIHRQPALSPRFTEGMFVPAMQTPENPGDFTDDYLALMAYFGANALKFYINLFDLWSSNQIPELQRPDFSVKMTALRGFAQRLAEFGIDLYLHLNTPPLLSSEPVFTSHPQTKGAKVELFLEEFTGKSWHALCSSNEVVLKGYTESLAAIYQAVPEVAGSVAIIGGECFFHCFTRPEGSSETLTNCPHCHGRDPHAAVAKLVNALGAAGRLDGKPRRLYAWPYSAFIWSRTKQTQADWINFLDPDIGVLANFDCFDFDESTGNKVRLYDYNIKLVGPSSVFRAQRDACARNSIDILVKTETTTTPDTFFLPYIPVYFRWYERFKAIRESGAVGYMGQWRFYGMNGSIPEELQFHSAWNPDLTAEQILSTIAQRDFNLDVPAASKAIQGWKLLSEAWDDFPFSAMTAGEREGYMRGAWYLGPAHPLIFNPQSTYRLGPKFYLLRGDIAELASEDEVEALPKKPRYISDLLTCLPFGVENYLHLVSRCRQRWEAGLTILQSAFGDSPNNEASRELGICQMIGIHLQSLENVIRFYDLRDSLARLPQDLPSFEKTFSSLSQVAKTEVSNAERSLSLLENDPRIGFGYTYGEVYDADLVREKIRQCRYVLENELPRVESFIRFHIWQRYP